ncbi:hypothetical protein M426DRAFT_71586 [Hypoxylon sp. CI-4A]|nr:hypothetical protein M426DRAFT_71586 [Hypoxylon sp. CI-4A]
MNRPVASKRKAPLASLQRRVRARRDEPEEIPSNQSVEGSSEDEGEEGQSEEDEEQYDDESNSSEDEDVEDPSAAVSQTSFGALAKAQASLPSTRRGKGGNAQDDDSDSDSSNSDQPDSKPTDKSKSKFQPHRTNKHAPTEQSSKRQVTRRREVVTIHKSVARDPRFSAAVSARPMDEDRSRRAYGFLDEYRDSEIAQLRAAVKKTRDATAKEELKRALKSMEGRKQAQAQRAKEKQVIEEHRKREKELVKQGKTPFYLKKSEQKKRMLVDRFDGLKKRQVDRVIERRRKKLAAKERRDMPMPAPRREAQS